MAGGDVGFEDGDFVVEVGRTRSEGGIVGGDGLGVGGLGEEGVGG